MTAADCLTVGVPRERSSAETRVALVPDTVATLRRSGFPDAAYVAAGAEVRDDLGPVGVVACVGAPAADRLRGGQVVVGLLGATAVDRWGDTGITGVDLTRLPRTLSRAQPLDALTSQATVTGYKAAIVAADTYGGFFPMLSTASGTVRPARVLVLGAGVAGLQRLATARRLGALVTGYDVRVSSRDEVRSVGARFLALPGTVDASAAGGYARVLAADERQAQQRALDERIGSFDVVITCAAVPGHRPPVLVGPAALAALAPGSVVLDTATGPLGGNVAGAVDGSTIELGGVLVVGAGQLPRRMPRAASTAYAHTIVAALRALAADAPTGLHLDPHDEVVGPLLVGAGVAPRPALEEVPV